MAFKATIFVNGGYEITELAVRKLTDTAVVLMATEKQIQNQNNEGSVHVRETAYTRYCCNKIEALEFLAEKYKAKIATKESILFNLNKEYLHIKEEINEKLNQNSDLSVFNVYRAR